MITNKRVSQYVSIFLSSKSLTLVIFLKYKKTSFEFRIKIEIGLKWH